MPVVHPADIWRASGRYDAIGPELTRFKDRNGRDMVLAMTHEEVVGLLLADIVQSYRQLPVMVYHFQTKWRDEPRARGGLIRVREFVMKDAYSCDRDEAGLDVSYEAQTSAYIRTFERLGLETEIVGERRRDHGRQPGPRVHGPQPGRRGRPRPVRRVRLRGEPPGRPDPARPILPPRSRCHARRSRRRGRRRSPRSPRSSGSARSGPRRPRFFVAGDGRLVTAIVRGDHEVNETKLANAVGATTGLRPATVEEIKAAGMEPGYGSPIGAHDTVVVVDELVARSPNLVAGANREGFHFRNVNVGRDFSAGRRRRHHERPGGRPVSDLRLAGHPAQRDRGRQHLQARDEVHRRGRGDVSRRGRQASTRSSWARTGSASGGTSPASSRPITTRRGSSGRRRSRRTPPTSSRSAANRDPQVAEVADRLHERRRGRRLRRDPLRRPRRVAGREVHRRRAARDALDPDRLAALPRGRRRRGRRSARPANGRPARSRRSRR